MAKTCNICLATSNEVDFYTGVSSRCKECHKKKSRENRAQKIEYYRAYDALRFQNDPKVRERHKRYASTPEGKAAANRSRAKWLAGNGEKRAAHVILGNAVRDGRVTKPEFCQVCGRNGVRIDGHHEDYAKPLEVLWCCRSCHVKLHARNDTIF